MIPQIHRSGIHKGKIYPSGRMCVYRVFDKRTSDRAAKILPLESEPQDQSLTLSDDQNSHMEKSERRIPRLTKYARASIRESAATLSKRYEPSSLLFGTLTLPSYPELHLEYLCKNWAELMRQFFQWYGRQLVKRGIEKEYLYVSEIQEKRSKARKDKLGIYHCHWIGRGKTDDGKFIFSTSEIREYWSNLCFNFVHKSIMEKDINSNEVIEYKIARINIQIIKKSIGAYMSKYLSKGIRQGEEDEQEYRIVKENHAHYFWGMSKELRNRIDEYSHEIRSDIIDTVMDYMERRRIRDRSIIKYERKIFFNSGDQEINVATIYQLSKSFENELIGLINEIYSYESFREFNNKY